MLGCFLISLPAIPLPATLDRKTFIAFVPCCNLSRMIIGVPKEIKNQKYRATNRFIEILADHGLAEACQRQPARLGGGNVMGGHVTHRAVAEAHGMKYVAPQF